MDNMSSSTMELMITSHHFVVSNQKEQLVMERITGTCFSTRDFDPLSHNVSEKVVRLPIFGLIGVVPIKHEMYLLVIHKATAIGDIDSQEIFRIDGVYFIDYKNKSRDPEVEQIKKNLREFLTSGFFFSNTYDLTNNYEKSFANSTLHERANTPYYWNLALYKDFLIQNVSLQWMLPIVHGYVGISQFQQGNSSFKMVIISRRHKENLDTGINDMGHAANYIETEQIFQVDRFKFSFTQSRGSVPIFWTRENPHAKSPEANFEGFKHHISQMMENFQRVIFVNLMSTLGIESVLTQAWMPLIQAVRKEAPSTVAGIQFDIAQKVREGGVSTVEELMRTLEADSTAFGFYTVPVGNINSQQKTLLRSTCLDCLDKSNLVQTFVAWEVIVRQMKVAGFDSFQLSLAQVDDYIFGQTFKALWTMNGDVLSQQTRNSPSIVSIIPANSKELLKQMLPIERSFAIQLTEADRKIAMQTFLRLQNHTMLQDAIQKDLNARLAEYTVVKDIRIRVSTWNLAGGEMSEKTNLLPLLLGDLSPDIIVASFQEIVKLNPYNVVVGNNQKNKAKIKSAIDKQLNACGETYNFLISEDLVGCAIFLYAKPNIPIRNYLSDKVKVGFMNTLGNKGSVLVRFDIFDTKICVYNCHLESGSKATEARKSQLRDIVKRGFQKSGTEESRYRVDDHDIKILSGDLNFRVGLSYETAIEHLESENLAELIANEQLIALLNIETDWGYREPDITFRPTYKFVKGTSDYTKKKLRVPSWCDRILINGRDIENLTYGSMESFMESDHKPVFGDFLIYVSMVDMNKKSQVLREIIQTKESRPEEIPAQGPVEDLLDLGEIQDSKISVQPQQQSADPFVQDYSIQSSPYFDSLSTSSTVPHKSSSAVPQTMDLLGFSDVSSSSGMNPPPSHFKSFEVPPSESLYNSSQFTSTSSQFVPQFSSPPPVQDSSVRTGNLLGLDGAPDEFDMKPAPKHPEANLLDD